MLDSLSRRYWVLFGGTSVWVVSILAAPFLESNGLGGASWIYLFFSRICHQEPLRSFSLGGHPVAVCARCAGLYFGFWCGLLLFPHLRRLRSALEDRPRLILLFFLPMGIDLLTSNTHLSRLISGSIAAFPVAFFLWLAVEQIDLAQPTRRLQ